MGNGAVESTDAVAGLEVILRNCEKLLDGIGFFAVSEWEHLEEFEGKVANEVPGADTEYGNLEGELIGVSPVGLFVGDIVRLGACDGIEYLQVVACHVLSDLDLKEGYTPYVTPHR